MDVLDRRRTTAFGLDLELFQGPAQGGSAREGQVRRILCGLAQADPDMEELQMGGKRTRRRQGRFEDGPIRSAAADRDQD
jgi:hypothetical protein